MKSIAILAFAAALEAGFLLTLAVPAPVLARAEAAVRERVVAFARVAPRVPQAARSRS